MRFIASLSICLFVLATTVSSTGLSRVCYLLATEQHEPIPKNQMNWNLCTHIIFGFARVSDVNIVSDTLLLDYMNLMIKTNHTNLKFLVSIGVNNLNLVKNDTKIKT